MHVPLSVEAHRARTADTGDRTTCCPRPRATVDIAVDVVLNIIPRHREKINLPGKGEGVIPPTSLRSSACAGQAGRASHQDQRPPDQRWNRNKATGGSSQTKLVRNLQWAAAVGSAQGPGGSFSSLNKALKGKSRASSAYRSASAYRGNRGVRRRSCCRDGFRLATRAHLVCVDDIKRLLTPQRRPKSSAVPSRR